MRSSSSFCVILCLNAVLDFIFVLNDNVVNGFAARFIDGQETALNTGWSSSKDSTGETVLTRQAELVTAHGEMHWNMLQMEAPIESNSYLCFSQCDIFHISMAAKTRYLVRSMS